MTPTIDDIRAFIDVAQSSALTHEIMAVCLGAVAIVLWLITWYIARSEYLIVRRWTPLSKNLGWASARFFFWIGVLFGILSLFQFFADNPVPLWAILLILAIFQAAMLLFRAMAQED